MFNKNKKFIVSILLITGLVTAQPLAAFSCNWGFSYLTSAYGTVTGCTEQLKNNFKTIATTAVIGATVGYAASSNNIKSSVLVAVAGILVCHALYSHWDQAEKRKAELAELKAKSSTLESAQNAQLTNLAAAQNTAQKNTATAEKLQTDIVGQTAQVANLSETLDQNTATLGQVTQAVTTTSAAITAGLETAKNTAVAQVAEHTAKLAETIGAQEDTVTALADQTRALTVDQAACATQIAAASKQLETTNMKLTKLTSTG